ncbi:unnamed protein product [Dovyalis caffra]|uniref:Agenet domain-containing protein n=1 Tax=Dovyalis caffra TaxID=77055 RepID=A0AAV1R0B5_9ROSI|nr:unnamed protein product [Dovyalis caffra]
MPHLSHGLFNKGYQVEVLKREKGPNTLTYCPATVLQSNKNQVFIEYQTLIIESNSNGPKRISEFVDLGFVRPNPPRGNNERFKVNDNVDVYCDNGWHKGTVKDILENSMYVVGFDGQYSEGIITEQCDLRLHREWNDGSLLCLIRNISEMEVKSRKIRLKIKYSKEKKKTDIVGKAGDKMQPILRNGTLVEVKSDEEGYDGAWFGAIIVGSVGRNAFLVQYLYLVTEDETAPLREIANEQNIRPNPPEVQEVINFKLHEMVDAWHNEGWWHGVVSSVLNGFKYMFYFSSTADVMEFEHARLRPHQDWINGKWIKGKERNPKPKFGKGTKVEVKSEEVGFQGSWYTATTVEVMENDKFLVQYDTLVTDDETDSLREEAVDAWYNDGWWVGRIIKVQKEMKHIVLFQNTEELEFEHCELRPHQEWIDGNWFTVPKAAITHVAKFCEVILKQFMSVKFNLHPENKIS